MSAIIKRSTSINTELLERLKDIKRNTSHFAVVCYLYLNSIAGLPVGRYLHSTCISNIYWCWTWPQRSYRL